MLGVGSLLTLWYAGRIVLVSFFGSSEALCRSCNSVARRWSQAVLKLAGVTVQVEGAENLASDGAFILIANHESWFDVWALDGGVPISVEGMQHSDRDGLRDRVRDAVARLRGGEGRTSRLPGEPPLDDVPERLSSKSSPS